MQKNDTVESMNVEIARFEGRKFYGKYSIDDYGPHHGLTYPEMKYHVSWDWAMNAWKELRQAIWNHWGEYPAEFCSISDAWEQYCFIVDIELAHGILHKAITWYNENKKNKLMSSKEYLESLLIVGATIKIGKQYAEEIGGFKPGEIITLVEGTFEHDNGLYVQNQITPAIWNEEADEFDSIYHLFGNKFENWYDCEIVKNDNNDTH